jgi:hypothetical protein
MKTTQQQRSKRIATLETELSILQALLKKAEQTNGYKCASIEALRQMHKLQMLMDKIIYSN